MTDIHEAREAIDGLSRAWHAFKEENERKATRDEGKLERINGDLDSLSDQIGRIETAINRTPAGDPSGTRAARSPERKAFLSLLRKGPEAMEPDERKALTVSDDTTGGYLAPEEYVRELTRGVTEFSPIREIARVRQTSSRAVKIPKRTGTFAAQWVSESGARSETTGLTFGLEEIAAHEMYALVDLSQQNIEDSAFDLEAELTLEFTEQFGVLEGAAFVNGNAVGQPEGFMANASVASDNSGSASTVKDANGQADGLIALQHNLKESYARRATWVLNRKTLGKLRQMKDGNNNYIWQPGTAPGNPNTILGDPYVEATDMPDEAANAFPIAYGDFMRGYIIVDEVLLSILRDPYTQATSGNVRFIARRRVGGQVVVDEAIRKLKCAA